MKIYLIRHAETTMNKKGKVFCGKTDCPISDDGAKTAEVLASTSKWNGIDRVYITPLLRTKQTADILFSQDIPRTVVPEFSEVDFGAYEGRLMSKEAELDPVFYKWLYEPEDLTFPGGENLRDHAYKAVEALKNIAKEDYSSVAIVAHSTTIRLILSLLLTNNIKFFRNIPCSNCGVSVIETDHNRLCVKSINIVH